MRYMLILLVVTVIAIVSVITARVAFNPLRQSDAELRRWLLAQTPLGSSSNEVHTVLEPTPGGGFCSAARFTLSGPPWLSLLVELSRFACCGSDLFGPI